MSETTDPKTSTSSETAMRPTDARDLVHAQLYSSEEDVLRDALRHLLRARPDARVHVAVHRYQTERLSLAKAADLAGVSWAQMREILVEKGVQPRLGSETLQEAEEEIQVMRDFLGDR